MKNNDQENLYELVFILKEEKEEILENLKKLIESIKGKIVSQEKWGKKNFAYKIKKFTSGFYFLWQISTEPKNISPLKKKLDINDDILRYLLLKV